MPVELPVAPIPSQDPKKKKEKTGDDESKPEAGKEGPGGKPTDEEELASRSYFAASSGSNHYEFSLKRTRL